MRVDKAIKNIKRLLKDAWTVTTPEQEILNDLKSIIKKYESR